MRFRDRHQDPRRPTSSTRRESTTSPARGVHRRHSSAPWFVSMVGFVAGLPFLYQMVPARAAARGAEVPPPAHRHAEADRRPRRLLRLHLLGARRRRLPDVRHHAGADLRPDQQLPTSRTSWCFFKPGDIVKFEPIDRERYDAHRAEVEAGTLRLPAGAGDVRPRELQRGPRRLQRAAAGGAPCRLRSSKPGLSTTVQDRGRDGLLPRRHPAVAARMDQFSRARREPARRQQPRRRRCSSAATWARSCASASRRSSP